ncbi:c-type cytochrome domain-containing protein [Chitinophaga japonensis]|uniref:Putative membrane protein n=1 Tax=Chitinophaga japonensis TaxID=104662 RepID=A0A562TD72_CHIJA|nr:c-type cytochrome domain-containing protein [Chitinophaga japonensis]TWI91204.1 putative membrane protein [Chitinophaga japonensis]
MLLDIFTFTGRLHPLIVHLPIGFLLLAVLFDLLAYRPRYAYLRAAVPLTLLAGFAAAALACGFGYLLSLSGDYDAGVLGRHKRSGIFLAIVAGVLWALTIPRIRTRLQLPAKAFSALLAGLLLLTGYAGHLGGSLTHGDDYLSLAVLTAQKRALPASVEEAFIYEDVVQPMLVKKCGQCHRPGKLKGELSVQDLASLLKGGKSGPALVAGQPEQSELYKRITLDPDHEDFMPAEGKPPLKRSEVAIIRWWIAQASAAGGKKIGELKDPAAIQAQVAAFLGLGGTAAPVETVAGVEQRINPDIPLQADQQAIARLRQKGLMVRVMLHQPLMLDITLPAGSGRSINEIKDDLLKIGKNIIWLNLSANGFTEKDLAFLQELTNLEKLRLEKNPLGDGISAHIAALPHLEAVNLNETRISEAAVQQLAQHSQIRRVYSWKAGK